MSNSISSLDWNDTFLDIKHLEKSFPSCKVQHKAEEQPSPPYKIKFSNIKEVTEVPNAITVEGHIIPNRGPYPANQPKKNSVPFTPTQV